MSKRKIEDIINDAFVFVEGEQKLEERANALDFIAHLRESEIEVPLGEGIGEAIYKGEVVCYVGIESPGTGDTALIIFNDQVPGTWVTWGEHSTQPENVPEHIKKIVWENVKTCDIENCGGDCKPGMRKKVLGKEFDSLCVSSLMFDNPSGDALECVKLMVDARKRDILKNTERT